MPTPSLEVALAAPLDWLAPDGQTYKLTPLCFFDLAELGMYLAAVPVGALKHHFADGPEEQSRYFVSLAYTHVERSIGEPLDDTFAKGVFSVPGMTYALWLSLRHRQPDMSFESMRRWVSEKNFETIKQRVAFVTGLKLRDKSEKHPAPPTVPADGLGADHAGAGHDAGGVRSADAPTTADDAGGRGAA